jgi:hypothetical protein
MSSGDGSMGLECSHIIDEEPDSIEYAGEAGTEIQGLIYFLCNI